MAPIPKVVWGLRELAEASASRLEQFAKILFRGFTAEIPPILRLWDLEPCITATEFWRHLGIMAESIGANEDQVEGTARAFDALIGLSITRGLAGTDKSTMVVLQALTAASHGSESIPVSPRGFCRLQDTRPISKSSAEATKWDG